MTTQNTGKQESGCHLCDRGIPLSGKNHIPTQSHGMIPVLRCRKAITRADIAFYRQRLNEDDKGNEVRHTHGRFRQLKRLYGDYLYYQDRDRFMSELSEWLPTVKTASVKQENQMDQGITEPLTSFERAARLFKQAEKLGCDTPTESMIADAIQDAEFDTLHNPEIISVRHGGQVTEASRLRAALAEIKRTTPCNGGYVSIGEICDKASDPKGADSVSDGGSPITPPVNPNPVPPAPTVEKEEKILEEKEASPALAFETQNALSLESVLIGAAGLLDHCKREWGAEWSNTNQQVRDGITCNLRILSKKTPRTDRALQSTSNTSAVYVFASFARVLELELSESNNLLRRFYNSVDSLICGDQDLLDEIEKYLTKQG